MKIHAISDTHSKHHLMNLAGGDMLLHTGDSTSSGHHDAILNFLFWLETQPYTHKVVIPGNHDFGFEQRPEYWKDKFLEHGIHMLNDSGVEIEGIKIWGSPITPFFNNWAFNRWPAEIGKHWAMIPNDTEILLTHGPVKDILDMCVHPNGSDRESVGCPVLLDYLLKLPSVKLHVFGHIHEARGHTYKHGKAFVNACSLDHRYVLRPDGPIRIEKGFDGDYIIEE